MWSLSFWLVYFFRMRPHDTFAGVSYDSESLVSHLSGYLGSITSMAWDPQGFAHFQSQTSFVHIFSRLVDVRVYIYIYTYVYIYMFIYIYISYRHIHIYIYM